MRRNFYLMALLLAGFTMSGSSVFSQNKASAGLNLVWEELGPNNLGTKCRSISSDGSGNLWAASMGGGVFKSTNGGTTWSQVTSLGNVPASSIAVDGSNIYVGTGELVFYEFDLINGAFSPTNFLGLEEGFLEAGGAVGQGVYVSNDGGVTWQHNNGTWNGSSSLYTGDFVSIQKVVTRGGRTLIATLKGLYYSDNADLSTVTKADGSDPANGFDQQPIQDIELGAGSTVWACTEDSVYKSTDNGATWGKGLNALLPLNPGSPVNNRLSGKRVEIAVSPSDPNVVYVTGVLESNRKCVGVFKTTDNGASWIRVIDYETGASFAPFQENGKYACLLDVDPLDPNRFYVGGEALFRYDEIDGMQQVGSDLYIPGLIDDYIPARMHGILHNPSNPDQYWIYGDQEISRTDDDGETFTFKTKGFNSGHLFTVSAAANYNVLASERILGTIFKQNGDTDPSNLQFNLIYDDNMGISRFAPNDPNHIVATGTDLGLMRSVNAGGNFERFYGPPKLPIHPSLTPDTLNNGFYIDRQNANTDGGSLYDTYGTNGPCHTSPWCFDPYLHPDSLSNDTSILEHPTYIYYCSRRYVWVVTNPFGGIDSIPAWNRLTNSLLSTGASPREWFTAITVDPSGTHTVFAATNYGHIFRIKNAHDPLNMDITANLAQIDTATGLPQRWITDLEVDPNNNNNLVVTFGGFETGDPGGRVYMTNAAMDPNPANITFHSVDDPSNIVPVYSAAFHPDASVNALLIGREDGLYTTTDNWSSGGSLTWTNESGPLANVPVTDIFIRPYYMNEIDPANYSYAPNRTIFVATDGRGVFKSNTTVATEPVKNVPAAVQADFFPNPTEGSGTLRIELPKAALVQAEIFSVQGTRVGKVNSSAFHAGTHEIGLDFSDLNSGVYFVNLSVNDGSAIHTKTVKAVVIR